MSGQSKTEPVKEIALGWIDKNRERLVDFGDRIWSHPELGLSEHGTSALLADELAGHGFRIEREVAGMATAFTAAWGEGKPVIGILGELDALAGLSQKADPHQDPVEEGAPGHGCGHNLHAAVSPEMGIRALDTVELMNTGVNYLREHVPKNVSIHYIIEEGGEQPNVVPAYARSWYYIRAPEREQVEQVYQKVLSIADGADLMTGAPHESEFLTGCCNKLPNAVLSKLVTDNMRRIGPPGHTEEERLFAAELAKTIPVESKRRSLLGGARPGGEELLEALFDERVLDAWDDGKSGTGSTDVADVSWVTPTMEFSTACCVLGTTAHKIPGR